MRPEEIEAIAHNVAKICVDVQIQKTMQLDNQAMPSAKEISVEYLYAYLKSKETTMEYIKRKDAEEKEQNPFSENYSQMTEHPKLTPHREVTDNLYEGKSI